MKKHIMEDGKWHLYAWVYNKGRVILYVDGKVYKGKLGITSEYWLKGRPKKEKGVLGDFDELRISKCARRIK